jgi:hypothetical protein
MVGASLGWGKSFPPIESIGLVDAPQASALMMASIELNDFLPAAGQATLAD